MIYPLYLWILCLLIQLLFKIYLYLLCLCCHSKISTCTEWQKFIPSYTHLHSYSQLRLNKESLCIFSFHTINMCPFCGLFSATHFAFLCFLFCFAFYNAPPSVVLKCCLVFLSTRSCDMAYRENASVRNKSWLTVLLAMSSMLMNQQYVSHKVCLSRNTHKVIYWSIKENLIRGS